VYKQRGITLLFTLCLWAGANLAQAQIKTQAADPTRPLGFASADIGAANSAQETISLNSILISRDRKIAIINGQPLHENETLKGVGALVKKIDAEAVTLQQGNKIWRVPLNKIAIRK
jgi:MSHA biogenesis protein MshK